MKTANFPSLRVDPALRQAAEDSLLEGETISGFVEQAVRDSILRRQHQREFVARGLAAGDAAAVDGTYVSAEAVLGRLGGMLAEARAKADVKAAAEAAE